MSAFEHFLGGIKNFIKMNTFIWSGAKKALIAYKVTSNKKFSFKHRFFAFSRSLQVQGV
jgi:hypothetical protein